MLMRNTSAPAANRGAMVSRSLEAGPRGAMILTRRRRRACNGVPPHGFAAVAAARSIATRAEDAALPGVAYPRLRDSKEAELTPALSERLRFRLDEQYAPRTPEPRRLATICDACDFNRSHYAANVVFIWPIYIRHKVYR